MTTGCRGRYLGIGVYSTVFSSAISIPLLFMLQETADAASLVRSLSVQFNTVVVLVAVLGTKLIMRKRHNAEQAAKKAVAAQRRGA